MDIFPMRFSFRILEIVDGGFGVVFGAVELREGIRLAGRDGFQGGGGGAGDCVKGEGSVAEALAGGVVGGIQDGAREAAQPNGAAA